MQRRYVVTSSATTKVPYGCVRVTCEAVRPRIILPIDDRKFTVHLPARGLTAKSVVDAVKEKVPWLNVVVRHLTTNKELPPHKALIVRNALGFVLELTEEAYSIVWVRRSDQPPEEAMEVTDMTSASLVAAVAQATVAAFSGTPQSGVEDWQLVLSHEGTALAPRMRLGEITGFHPRQGTLVVAVDKFARRPRGMTILEKSATIDSMGGFAIGGPPPDSRGGSGSPASPTSKQPFAALGRRNSGGGARQLRFFEDDDDDSAGGAHQIDLSGFDSTPFVGGSPSSRSRSATAPPMPRGPMFMDNTNGNNGNGNHQGAGGDDDDDVPGGASFDDGLSFSALRGIKVHANSMLEEHQQDGSPRKHRYWGQSLTMAEHSIARLDVLNKYANVPPQQLGEAAHGDIHKLTMPRGVSVDLRDIASDMKGAAAASERSGVANTAEVAAALCKPDEEPVVSRKKLYRRALVNIILDVVSYEPSDHFWGPVAFWHGVLKHYCQWTGHQVLAPRLGIRSDAGESDAGLVSSRYQHAFFLLDVARVHQKGHKGSGKDMAVLAREMKHHFSNIVQTLLKQARATHRDIATLRHYGALVVIKDHVCEFHFCVMAPVYDKDEKEYLYVFDEDVVGCTVTFPKKQEKGLSQATLQAVMAMMTFLNRGRAAARDYARIMDTVANAK